MAKALLKRLSRGLVGRAQPAQSPGPSPGSVQPAGPAPDPTRERYITRQGFIITDLVSEALPAEERFIILDGGAREALSDPRWQVFDKGRVRLYGFEPDAAEIEKLNAEVRARGLDYRYFAGALWSAPATLTFYENKASGGGSFYEQNTDLTDRWKFENAKDLFYARDIFYPTGTSEWAMTSLDAWAAETGVDDIDFMKLNVQGAELEILKGSESLLDGVIGVMAEISFVESYKERPFFADIDAYLRARNFAFFDLIGHHCMGRARSPITAQHLPGLFPLYGQLVEGHGVYFKDPIDMEARGLDIGGLSKEKLLKLVCFAEVFGQIEYAFELLLWLADLLGRRGNAAGAGEINALAGEAESRYRRYMS